MEFALVWQESHDDHVALSFLQTKIPQIQFSHQHLPKKRIGYKDS